MRKLTITLTGRKNTGTEPEESDGGKFNINLSFLKKNHRKGEVLSMEKKEKNCTYRSILV